jgi:hypothetical protein
MSVRLETPRERIPGTNKRWHIRGDTVICLWITAVGWIVVVWFIAPDHAPVRLWVFGVTVLSVAAASCAFIVWYICREIVEPLNVSRIADRALFKAGYEERSHEYELAEREAHDNVGHMRRGAAPDTIGALARDLEVRDDM